MTQELANIPSGADVEVDLLVDIMDHAAFEGLHGWRVAHEKSGGRVDIDERHEDWYESAVSGRPKVADTTPPNLRSAGFFGLARNVRRPPATEQTSAAAPSSSSPPSDERR